MIYLVYEYSRDVFKGNEFHKWIVDLFGKDVRFCGYGYARREPKISIPISTFLKVKGEIKTKNLIQGFSRPNVIESLAFGIVPCDIVVVDGKILVDGSLDQNFQPN